MKRILIAFCGLATALTTPCDSTYQRAWRKPFSQATIPPQETPVRYRKTKPGLSKKARSRRQAHLRSGGQSDLSDDREAPTTIIGTRKERAAPTPLPSTPEPTTCSEAVQEEVEEVEHDAISGFEKLLEAFLEGEQLTVWQDIIDQKGEWLSYDDLTFLLNLSCEQHPINLEQVKFLLRNGAKAEFRGFLHVEPPREHVACHLLHPDLDRGPEADRLLVNSELTNAAHDFTHALAAYGYTWHSIECREINNPGNL